MNVASKRSTPSHRFISDRRRDKNERYLDHENEQMLNMVRPVSNRPTTRQHTYRLDLTEVIREEQSEQASEE